MAAGRAWLAALICLSLLLALGACSDDGGDSATGDTTGGGALVDGRHFGRVTALDPGSGTLGFDVADLDGDRIDDPDAEVVSLPVSDDVEIRLLDPCCELTPASFEEWLEGFEPDERSFYTTSLSHYWVTLEAGEVVAVDEQYLPQ